MTKFGPTMICFKCLPVLSLNDIFHTQIHTFVGTGLHYMKSDYVYPLAGYSVFVMDYI